MANKKITPIESAADVAHYCVLGAQIEALQAQIEPISVQIKALQKERDALKEGIINAAEKVEPVASDEGFTFALDLFGFSVVVTETNRAGYTVPAGVRKSVKVG